jgi:diacylglycerol kinase (ATP)
MTLSEEAAIDDNKLDVYRLEVSRVIAALKLLPSLRAGTQGRWSEVSRSLAKRYLLKQPTRSINADGKSHRRRHISGWTRGAEVAVNGFEYQN